MSRRPQLSRQVPATPVSKFDDWCEREGHLNGGDKGRRAEQAIVEYLPPSYRPERYRNEMDVLESDLRADLKEVGHLDDDSSVKVMPASSSGDETVKLTYRIAEDVQEALEKYVYDQEEKVRGVIGEYIAAALDEHRAGGQVGRVRRYYEQLRENVDMISGDRIGSVVEKLKENTGNRDDCHIEEIKIAVDETLEVHSDEMEDIFADRVIKHLGYEAVETSDGLYATPERAEKLVQQHDVECGTDWYQMDKDDRVEYLLEAMKARSRQTAKGAGVNYNQVRDEIFEGHPSDDYCYELMELAGDHCGFEYGRHRGQKMLRHTGKGERSKMEPDEGWTEDAAQRVLDFCDQEKCEIKEVSQSILDNRIVRAKYPEEYEEIMGPSARALDSVTEDDRDSVLNHINRSSDNDEDSAENSAGEIMDQLTVEAQAVTDGGSNNNNTESLVEDG